MVDGNAGWSMPEAGWRMADGGSLAVAGDSSAQCVSLSLDNSHGFVCAGQGLDCHMILLA